MLDIGHGSMQNMPTTKYVCIRDTPASVSTPVFVRSSFANKPRKITKPSMQFPVCGTHHWQRSCLVFNLNSPLPPKPLFIPQIQSAFAVLVAAVAAIAIFVPCASAAPQTLNGYAAYEPPAAAAAVPNGYAAYGNDPQSDAPNGYGAYAAAGVDIAVAVDPPRPNGY